MAQKNFSWLTLFYFIDFTLSCLENPSVINTTIHSVWVKKYPILSVGMDTNML